MQGPHHFPTFNCRQCSALEVVTPTSYIFTDGRAVPFSKPPPLKHGDTPPGPSPEFFSCRRSAMLLSGENELLVCGATSQAQLPLIVQQAGLALFQDLFQDKFGKETPQLNEGVPLLPRKDCSLSFFFWDGYFLRPPEKPFL